MMTKYGALVKVLRARQGWSQEEFAEKLHMSRSALSRLENDEKTLDVPTLIQMIQVTNTPEIAVAVMLGMDGLQIMQQILPLLGFGLQIL